MEKQKEHVCIASLITLCDGYFSGLVELEDGWRAWSTIWSKMTDRPLAANGNKTPEMAVETLMHLIKSYLQYEKATEGKE